MASKKPPTTGTAETAAETRLREAQEKVKAATERHAAIVAVMSRLSATPQERRLAQSQAKKVEHELHDAKRLLQEAQMAAGDVKAPAAR